MYSEQLIEFLNQAKTDNLKTKHFRKAYLDTKVKVSFGQGVSARIPWISFLKKPFTVSEGIYPVYLYYKNEDKLILAYGISETKKTQIELESEKKNHKAIDYLDSQQIKVSEVASFFPNYTTLDLIDFRGDKRAFAKFTGKNKYVLNATVYNLSDEELKILNSNYSILKEITNFNITITIYILNKK